ncbi:MAG: transglycosylase SLT domain-containing protein [Actinomycetota bacterium]
MGFPMRYPRFLSSLFVALVFVMIPAIPARADAPTKAEMLERVDTIASIADRASETADLALRGGVIDLIARHGDLSHADADLVLDAVTGTILALSEAGERSGVLDSLDVETVYDTVLEFMGSVDPQARQALAKAAHYRTHASETDERMTQVESEVLAALLASRQGSFESDVERWRPLVEEYFPLDQVDEALAVMTCESEGDPDAKSRRSSASGLFQFLSKTWAHASVEAGFGGASVFSPEANVASAAWLVDDSLTNENDAWQQWSCKP